MLPILVLIKPFLPCSSMYNRLNQLSRLGNLWLVAQFANVRRMSLSCSKVVSGLYLSLQGNLSNALWISLQIFLQFRVRMACLYVLISLISSISSSLYLWGRESLVLSMYHNSSLTILCNFLEFLTIYSMIEIFVTQLSFGRVYSRHLVPRLSFLQLTIHRLMVRLRDKTELQRRIYVIWYMRVVQSGCMLFL